MVDIAVLVSVAVGTAVLAYLIRRWGTRGRRFWETLWLGFFGLFLVISMVAHCLDVLSRLALGTSYAGEPFPYNFRVYSLFLLGAVLIALGLQLLQQVRDFARWNAGGTVERAPHHLSGAGGVRPSPPGARVLRGHRHDARRSERAGARRCEARATAPGADRSS